MERHRLNKQVLERGPQGRGTSVRKGRDLEMRQACASHSNNWVGLKHQFGFILWAVQNW